jgi:hypothetical protein
MICLKFFFTVFLYGRDIPNNINKVKNIDMKTSKWYIGIFLLFFSCSVIAQNDAFGDDIYVSTKNKKHKPAEMEEKTIKEKKENPIVVTARLSERDVDEYNRRYVEADNYINESADTIADNYKDGELTQRIIKFHDPSKIMIVGADNLTIYYDGKNYELNFEDTDTQGININYYGEYAYPYYRTSPWYYGSMYSPWRYSWYYRGYDPWWYNNWFSWYYPDYYGWYSPWFFGGYYGGWYGSNHHHHHHYYERSSGHGSRGYSNDRYARTSRSLARSSVGVATGRSSSMGNDYDRTRTSRTSSLTRGDTRSSSNDSGRQSGNYTGRTRAIEESSGSGSSSVSRSSRSDSGGSYTPSSPTRSSNSSDSYVGRSRSSSISSGGGSYSGGGSRSSSGNSGGRSSGGRR